MVGSLHASRPSDDGCVVAHSLDEALKAAGDGEVMVIGGAQIYAEFLPRAHKMYLTFIQKEFQGDAFFPEFNRREWTEISREEHDDGQLKYSFVDFVRKV